MLFILFKLRRWRHLYHWMIHQIYWHHYIQKGNELLILVNWCTCTTKDNLKEKTMLHQVRNLHFCQITTCIKKWVSVGIMFKWNEWLLNSGKVFLSLMKTHVQASNNLLFKCLCSVILMLTSGYSRLVNMLCVIDSIERNVILVTFEKHTKRTLTIEDW